MFVIALNVLFCVHSYMCFRLLGGALPLLSVPQLRQALSGEVMRHYGEHVVVAQVGQPKQAQCGRKSPLYIFFDPVQKFDSGSLKGKSF